MATFTQLSPIALPGKRYSFVAKTPAVGGKGLGPFTAQSITATPGIIHSFVAKTPAAGGVKGAGLFTELSATALPGMQHAFLPKTVAPVSAYSPPPYLSHGHGGWPDVRPRWEREEIRKKVLKDDDELFEMIAAILPFLE